MSEKIDWGFLLTAGGFVLTVIGIIIGGKKIVQKNSPKTKFGDIDMSKSEFIMKKEVNKYTESKDERKE